jgi:hypothetical protein
VGLYEEPLGGHQTLLSILPIDRIEHKRLADVISKTGVSLTRPSLSSPSGEFWTPNGLASPQEKVASVVKKLKEGGLGESIFAFVCRGAHQPIAMDQGRRPAV